MILLILEYFLNLFTCCTLFFLTIYQWLSFTKSPFHDVTSNTKYPLYCFYGSILALSIVLITRWLIFGYLPLSNLYESLVVLNWLCLILASFVKTEWKLIVIIPISLLIQLFLTFTITNPVNVSPGLVPALQSNWLLMHVSMMILSYALLILGSILSVLWLTIKHSNLVLIDSLTIFSFNKKQQAVLKQIDYWSYRLIGLGFPFLTLGIISGAVWANEAWGNYWSWDPKETWALLTWILFAIYLHMKLSQDHVSNTFQSAVLATFGLAIIWMCYLGVNLLGKGLHTYGWFTF
jgi:cytochrome c-type biogenesis protein CcsB